MHMDACHKLRNAEVTLIQGTKYSKAHEMSKDNIDHVNVLTDEFHTRVLMNEPATAPLKRELSAKALIYALLALKELTEKQVDCKNESIIKPVLTLLNKYRPTSGLKGEDLRYYAREPLEN